jgi:hypothetical protein
MTPEQRQAARERCDKATPGPWRGHDTEEEVERWWGAFPANAPQCLVMAADDPVCCTNDDGVATETEWNNGIFIAHARADLPAALDALDAADSHQAQSDLRISNQRAEINRLTHELRESERRFQVFATWRRECEMWRDKTSMFWEIQRLKKRVAELSEENSQMARMLAEPSENQELKARIAELESDAEFLTTPDRLAEIIGKKNARIAELEADKARLNAAMKPATFDPADPKTTKSIP